MSTSTTSNWRDWIPVLSVALAVLGMLANAFVLSGDTTATVRGLVQDVAGLKAERQRQADLLGAIDVRTARIEAKLEMMTTARGDRPGH